MNSKVLLFLGGALLIGGWIAQRSTGIEGPRPTATVPDDELVALISRAGAAVELADHLQPDAWTLFEYGADW